MTKVKLVLIVLFKVLKFLLCPCPKCSKEKGCEEDETLQTK